VIERAAGQWPHAEALVGSARRWTWAEVHAACVHLADELHLLGVRPGQHVAVHRAKTAESLLAVWGVLAAGAVVVPVDAQLAPEVTAGMFASADVVAVLVDRRSAGRVPAHLPVLDVAAVVAAAPATAAAHRHRVERAPDDVAYLIFTSGSTGVPKAIVHTHASALAYASLVVDTYGLGPDDRVSGMSPLHFDMSTLELYAAPLAGSTVVVMDEALMRFPASFSQRASAERVTVWYTVPFFLQQLAARGALDQHDLGSLRWLLYGGEAYSPAALGALLDQLPPTLTVGNVYGPAEVNQCTVWNVTPHGLDREAADVPLGDAWGGSQLAVVDPDGRPVPDGEPGELVVTATTAMQGYWRQPELTARTFRERPELGPGRWYSTGDLVRRDEHGQLRYLGRRDHQVKIRGTRLELDGVEAVLGNGPGVLHVVAGPTPGADGIVAVVVPADDRFDEDALVAYARERLHPAAVPVRVIRTDHLPRTGSGKIDRRRVRAHLLEETPVP
jgi:amino acid adenylation domain-containing protein